jgi:hypothetical protein
MRRKAITLHHAALRHPINMAPKITAHTNEIAGCPIALIASTPKIFRGASKRSPDEIGKPFSATLRKKNLIRSSTIPDFKQSEKDAIFLHVKHNAEM